jgi:hypothetical protein
MKRTKTQLRTLGYINMPEGLDKSLVGSFISQYPKVSIYVLSFMQYNVYIHGAGTMNNKVFLI